MIRLSPIRLIGPDGTQHGVVETHEAMRMAQEAGLDLVEVVADQRPPVCKIMDYGKYRYELTKREGKSKSAGAELKEIRLGRSVKIDPHDVKIRVEQARKFLMAGHKVQIIQRFRGREMAHKELGEERLLEICHDLSDIAKIEMAPRSVGRSIIILLAPEKSKIESVKAKLAKEGQVIEEDLAKLEEEVARQNEQVDPDADDQADSGDSGDEDGSADDKKKKSRGPKDDRSNNPVDDEVADMLDEL